MRTATNAVLIVSDRQALAEEIGLALQRFGIASSVALEAVAAVQRLSESPRAVVVDLEFSDMDPRQILHRVTGCPKTQGIPIVAIGGTTEDSEGLLDLGCTAVLHRDVSARAVADAVAHLLRTADAGTSCGIALSTRA